MKEIPEWWAGYGFNFWEAYEAGEWEPDTHRIIDEYVTPSSTYVDVGAWIGPTVLWAAPHAGRVVAVEPDRVARDYLNRNTIGLANVEIVPFAIAARNERADIMPRTVGYGSGSTRLVAGEMGSGIWDVGIAETVRCVTLPTLFARFAISDVSLLKMDIEGGEASILEVVCPFLAERGVPFLVSLHHHWFNGPFDPAWFDCFSQVLGDLGADDPILCLP